MSRPRIAALALALSLLASASPARAQDGGTARELFERGYAALMDGRFPQARDLLRESLSRRARPATAFNLVLALLGTEQPVAATEVCARLLDGGYGELTRRHRAAAQRECARAERETGTLVIDVRGAEQGAETTIRIDGAEAAGEERPGGARSIRVEPGTHVVSASTDGRTVEQRVSVKRGATVHAALQLPPDLGLDDGAGDDGPSWALIGAGAGAAAAAVITTVVLVTSLRGSNGESEPITDPVFGVTEALR